VISGDLRDWNARLGGTLHGPALTRGAAGHAFTGVFTDSRDPLPGALFVALTGPRFDGHQFVQAVADAGAAAALVARPQPVALPQWVVPDPLAVLQTLASQWAQAQPAIRVALTGSVGKTTVKALCAAILGRLGPTLATSGNLNNHIGVPLTLARLDSGHRFAVLELGANHVGEIAALSGWVRPQVAGVTVAARAHLEGFGGIEGVIRGKGEIYEALPADGVAVLNPVSPGAEAFRARAGDRACLSVYLEGAPPLGDGPAVLVRRRAPDVPPGQIGLSGPFGSFTTRIGLAGAHNAFNAAFAVALAWAAAERAGIDAATFADAAAAALAAAPPQPGRLELRPGPGGSRILDDSYNASPDAVRAALAVLAEYPAPKALVLGELAELGTADRAAFREIAELARALGLARLWALGAAAPAADAFGRGEGFEGSAWTEVPALTAAVREWLLTQAGTATVLIKGSRRAGLERVVAGLGTEEAPAGDDSDLPRPGSREGHENAV